MTQSAEHLLKQRVVEFSLRAVFSFSYDSVSDTPSYIAGWHLSLSGPASEKIAPCTSIKPNSWDTYRDIIYKTDVDLNFGPEILDCIAGIESRWNPRAVSPGGTHKGLYQMNSDAWSDSGSGLSFERYATDPRTSTAAVVGELYKKLIAGAFGNNYRRFYAAWNVTGGLFSSQQINSALQGHRGTRWSELNLTYATTIQTCAFEMMMGRATRAYDWIYWYGQWEANFQRTHR